MAGFYSINLTTGAATLIGAVGPGGTALLGFAIGTAAGNDFLSGGAGADTFDGGPLEDTMVGGLGADTYDGGTGFDTILVQGTSNNDRIDAIQDSPTTLRYEVSDTLLGYDGVVGGAGTETDTLVVFPVSGIPTTPTVENVSIVSGSGDDIIRVTQSDSLIAGGLQALSLRFTVDAGAPAASDRLQVVDDGLGDTTIQRVGATPGTGSYQIGALAPVVYFDVEYAQLTPLDPIIGGTGTDGLGRLFVFKPDRYESNNSRLNATFLGSGSAINLDPTIDPGFDAAFGAAGDEDWYRIVAQFTGDLDIRVFFEGQGTLGNLRAGLPGDGNLDIALYDSNGLVGPPAQVAGSIAGETAFGTNEATLNDADERIRIPAVEGQTYYLRVRGAPIVAGANTSAAINVYNVSVINTPAPVPFDLELHDIVGVAEVDGAPATTATTFSASGIDASFVLSTVDDFYNGKDIYFTNGPLNGLRGRVLDYVGATQTFSFAAGTFPSFLTLVGFTGSDFQIESIDTGRSQFDNVTRDTTPTLFIRVADSALLNDIPDNGAAPGSPPDQTIAIPFVTDTSIDVPTGATPRSGFRVAVFITENTTHTPVGFAQPVAGSPGVYTYEFAPGQLAQFAGTSFTNSFFLSARVEMIDPAQNINAGDVQEQAQGFGAFAHSLEIVLDTQEPPVFFGLPNDPNDGLLPDSDTGIGFNQPTLSDGVTSDTTPGFFGQAEANAIIRLFVDAPQAGFPTGNGIFQPGIDFQVGFDVAEPFDGTNQYPNGYWQIDSININLNAAPFPVDGLRTLVCYGRGRRRQHQQHHARERAGTANPYRHRGSAGHRRGGWRQPGHRRNR